MKINRHDCKISTFENPSGNSLDDPAYVATEVTDFENPFRLRITLLRVIKIALNGTIIIPISLSDLLSNKKQTIIKDSKISKEDFKKEIVCILLN